MQHHVHLGAAVQRHAGTMNRVLEGLLADDLACRSAVYCHDIRLNRKKMLVSRNKITKTKYPAVPCCRIYLAQGRIILSRNASDRFAGNPPIKNALTSRGTLSSPPQVLKSLFVTICYRDAMGLGASAAR